MKMLDVVEYGVKTLENEGLLSVQGGSSDPVKDAGEAVGTYAAKVVKGVGALLALAALFSS